MDQFRQWSDLPIGVLSSIADRLGLIDLLRFRGTCKDFRSASSTASAEIESSTTPWLLIPEPETCSCIIYDDKRSAIFTRDIPELKGAIFLASYQGWLLIFQHGSIFFFDPFSLAKVALPECSFRGSNDLPLHAAFTDVPTSPDCVVCVISWREITVISKGQSAWTHHAVPSHDCLFHAVTIATFDQRNRNFYFVDKYNSLLSFSVKDMKWNSYPEPSLLRYHVCNTFERIRRNSRDRFNIKDAEDVDVRGLTFHRPGANRPLVYPNEVKSYTVTKQHIRRAVWIQPRFFEVDPNQKW